MKRFDKTAVKRRTGQIAVKVLTLILMIGLSYIVLYPFLFKILASFMSANDLTNPMVNLIPAEWSLDRFSRILNGTELLEGMKNTVFYSLGVSVLTTFSAAFVGYGLARFKFKGSTVIMVLVVVTMLIPIQSIYIPMYSSFRFFDLFGLLTIGGGKGISMINTPWPMFLLAATCLGFRAGIFVILMRQYYIGIPNELVEAAYVDGSGVMKTFFQIILPMAKSMLVVVLSLSFAWQWTDTLYYTILNAGTKLLPSVVLTMNTSAYNLSNQYETYVFANTAALIAVIPLIIFYCFMQKQIIQGIERSGIVG